MTVRIERGLIAEIFKQHHPRAGVAVGLETFMLDAFPRLTAEIKKAIERIK